MKVISLINMKGGVGKTTLATNIFHCLAERYKKKVLLIDIDPQFNATQCLFSGDEYVEHLKNNKDTIVTIFDDNRIVANTVTGISERRAKELSDIEVVQFSENMYVLPGNLELYRIEFSPGSGKEQRLLKFLKILKERDAYDFVIIDTPPTPSIWMTSALIASDYYLVPVKPDPMSYTGIDLLKNIVRDKKENLDLDIKCIGLIFTMVERPDSVVYTTALKKINSQDWKKYNYNHYLPKRTNVAKTQMDGLFILDMEESNIKLALVGIVKELIDRIEADGKK